jgi:general secretion pathway protein M
MSSLRDWWAGRTERERRLLLVLGVVLGALIYWFGLVAPARSAAQSAELRHAGRDAELAEIEAGLGQLQALERARGGGRLSEPLEPTLRRTAAETGVGISAIQSTGAGVSARSETVAPGAFFRWIALLQRQYGVRVAELVLLKNPDGSLNVRVGFTGGGA